MLFNVFMDIDRLEVVLNNYSFSAGKPLRIPLSWRLFVANMLILRLALQDGFLFDASAGESICFGAAITVDEE